MRKARAPAAEDPEAGMRHGRPIEPEAAAVEAPGQLGIGVEVRRVSQIDERQPDPRIRRVGLPEAFIAAEIGKARVDAHARARAHQERVGLADQPRRRIQGGRVQTCLVHSARLLPVYDATGHILY
jgi:hypothetical protein